MFSVKVKIFVLSTLLLFTSLSAFIGTAGCNSDEGAPVVVVYTSVDQMFSEPILKEFERQTGIIVKAVYDVEATKTVGLANRLIAEKERPLADVFWNGEILQTLRLKEEGVLAPFSSPSAALIPPQYFDPAGYWVAIAGRARVFIVNTDLLSPEEYPSSIYDLLNPVYPADQTAIAYPIFGTTATHAAALYASLGPEQALSFFQDISDRGVKVVDGNSVVKDLVADGRMLFGLTDTDDACVAVKAGRPVAIVIPDQGEGQPGTLMIPNTVALINGAPHPREAQELIDYLLSEAVEKALVDSGWSHIPVRPLDAGQSCFDAAGIRHMEVDFAALNLLLEQSKTELTSVFIR